jgi:hypothetical protein
VRYRSGSGGSKVAAPASRQIAEKRAAPTNGEHDSDRRKFQIRCNDCGRVYNDEGIAISGPGKFVV